MGNLLDELRSQKEADLQDRRGANRRFVLARHAEIQAALQQGFTIKDVWRLLSSNGAIRIKYDAFRLLVRKYVQARTGKTSSVPSETDAEKTASDAEHEPLRVPDKPGPTFKWNPRPKKEDLI